ncbi:MAG: hypothetical protein WCF04_01665 [Candidatus Nanopelagicales bacterium]
MSASPPPARSGPRRLIAATTVLLLGFLGLSTPLAPRAWASPAQDYLGLADLQALLESAPDGVPGHMLTVVGGSTTAQQAPVSLPVTVYGVVPNAGPAGALLLFSADLTNPTMAKLGTIASGMSGSPILVEDGGVDKVVGAVSYGDAFTTNGLGMATPIEHMIGVERGGLLSSAATAGSDESAAPATTQASPRPIDPVTVDGRTITKVVVTAPGASPKAQAAAAAAAAADSSTAYFKPLFGMQIGGLPAGSAAYKRLAASVTKHGLPILPPHGSGSQGSAEDFQTTVEPGAAAGAFFSLGSVTFGGIGTVTYTTGDGGAVAFGHPMLWNGSTGAYFTNAWIDGVWTSSAASYKLGSAGQVRGTLVQDRVAGVGARLDAKPVDVPVTSTATVTDKVGTTTTRTATTRIAPFSFTTWFRSELPAAAAAQAIVSAADVQTMAGSAATELSIEVSDGTNKYTIERRNLFDDSYDVLWGPASDVSSTLETIFSTPLETGTASVQSVDLTTTITSTRAWANIVGIVAPGLRTGANTIDVMVETHDSKTARPVPVTLNIPAGMSVRGTVTASGGWIDSSALDTRSVATLVSSLNAAPANNDVVVYYRPEGAPESADPVRGVTRTQTVINGWGEAVTSAITLQPSARTITAGDTFTLRGIVERASDSDTVSVQRRTAGSSTWTTLNSAVDLKIVDEVAQFVVTDKPQYNSVYRVRYAGSGGTVLGSSADIGLAVRGRVALSGKATSSGFTLVAGLTPKRAGSQIVFERYSSGRWTAIRTVATGTDGRATYQWKVARGTYQVRARLVGTTDLSANVSATVRLSR